MGPLRSSAVVWLGLISALFVSACTSSITPSQYGQFARQLEAKGHLRTERAPVDAPFSNAQLARNFRKIAFEYEFYFDGATVVQRPLAKPLNRWEGPIRYRIMGDAGTEADAREIAELMAEVSVLTGLDIARVERGQNMIISIASPRGRERISEFLGLRGHPVLRSRYDTWRQTPGWICGATLSVAHEDANVLVGAHVFLGSEVEGTLRRACLHEEIVQSLGLTNDSRAARPSIFNDDQEFALMTEHDALLLRVLYDKRLQPGMPEREAMPIAERVIAELRQGTGGPAGMNLVRVRTGSDRPQYHGN